MSREESNYIVTPSVLECVLGLNEDEDHYAKNKRISQPMLLTLKLCGKTVLGFLNVIDKKVEQSKNQIINKGAIVLKRPTNKRAKIEPAGGGLGEGGGGHVNNHQRIGTIILVPPRFWHSPAIKESMARNMMGLISSLHKCNGTPNSISTLAISSLHHADHFAGGKSATDVLVELPFRRFPLSSNERLAKIKLKLFTEIRSDSNIAWKRLCKSISSITNETLWIDLTTPCSITYRIWQQPEDWVNFMKEFAEHGLPHLQIRKIHFVLKDRHKDNIDKDGVFQSFVDALSQVEGKNCWLEDLSLEVATGVIPMPEGLKSILELNKSDERNMDKLAFFLNDEDLTGCYEWLRKHPGTIK